MSSSKRTTQDNVTSNFTVITFGITPVIALQPLQKHSDHATMIERTEPLHAKLE
jgi:hypothetical protein